MLKFETIELDIGNGIGRLTLNRPESLNAFNDKMAAEMYAALKELSADRSVRCVAVTGKGISFCSGRDISEPPPGKSYAELLRQRYNPIIRIITGMEKPAVALINGNASGAGMSLALACDFRVMAASARLTQDFIRGGLVPDSGSSYFLPRLVGHAKAFEMSALGEEITSDAALKLGIINCVFTDDNFKEESAKILKRLSDGPTKAYSFMKKMLMVSAVYSLEQTLEYEAYMQEIAGRTEDAREATEAFAQKRSPTFKGR